MNKRKSKRLRTIIVVLLLCICLLTVLTFFLYCVNLHMQYQMPNYNYFGAGTYREIFHIASPLDRAVAYEIIDDAEEAFSFICDREEAKEKFGYLGHYSVTYDDAASEEHEIKFITTDIGINHVMFGLLITAVLMIKTAILHMEAVQNQIWYYPD